MLGIRTNVLIVPEEVFMINHPLRWLLKDNVFSFSVVPHKKEDP